MVVQRALIGLRKVSAFVHQNSVGSEDLDYIAGYVKDLETRVGDLQRRLDLSSAWRDTWKERAEKAHELYTKAEKDRGYCEGCATDLENYGSHRLHNLELRVNALASHARVSRGIDVVAQSLLEENDPTTTGKIIK